MTETLDFGDETAASPDLTQRSTPSERRGDEVCCVEELCQTASGNVQLRAAGKAQPTNAGFPTQVHAAVLPPGTQQIPTSPPKSTLTAPVDPQTGEWSFGQELSGPSIGPAERNRINYVVFWFEYRFENPMTGQVITYYSLEARSVIPRGSDLPVCPVESVAASAAEEEPAPLIAPEAGPLPSPKGRKRTKKKA
jgi:hypothetical protein